MQTVKHLLYLESNENKFSQTIRVHSLDLVIGVKSFTNI
jgi:hypothetical protein